MQAASLQGEDKPLPAGKGSRSPLLCLRRISHPSASIVGAMACPRPAPRLLNSPASCRLKLARPLSGPALDHNLLFCVKLDSVTSLGMHIAKETFLPAREREEGHRRSHANVDANIACLSLVAELACR